MIRLLVVDDQRLVRRCICARLQAVADFTVVAEAASGEEARAVVREHDPDIVLMDLNMPGMGGLETTRRLLRSAARPRIIGLSMYTSGPFPQQFLRLGGAGYVSKDTDADDLVSAIRRVHAGGCYISPDVARNIAASVSLKLRRHGVDALSRRELQVLQHIAQGSSVAEIAACLALSTKTVAHYRRMLLDKLDARNDVQLAHIAHAQGIADSDALSPP